MSNKKKLICGVLTLVVLAVVVIIAINGQKKSDSNFKAIVNEVNVNTIDKIVYKTPENDFDISVERQSDDSWIIKAEGKEWKADTVRVNTLFSQAANTKPIRIASISKDTWKSFEVDNEKGIHAKYYSNGNIIKEFYIGKCDYIDYDPQTLPGGQHSTRPGKTYMASYIREKDDNNVYVVNGNVRFSFPKDPNGLRRQTIYSNRLEDFTEISVQTKAGNSIVMTKNEDGKWLKNGVLADSARARLYTGKLRSMICNTFVDKLPDCEPDAVLTIKGTSFDPVVVNFYPYDEKGFVVNSSTNPEGYFLDREGVLRRRIEEYFDKPSK